MTQPLPPMPARIAGLPRDHRGFPIPWFVQWLKDGKPVMTGEGEPDFRVMDGDKLAKAVSARRCWVCGGIMGRHLCFPIGPMCAVNRVTAEPASHFECAEFSARACPFLTRPRMRRNKNEMPEGGSSAGFAIERNPGVVCLWSTQSYRIFRPHIGGKGILFRIGDPDRVLWFAEGRVATRDEVVASIDSGYPLLLDLAKQDGADAIEALAEQRLKVDRLLPAA